MGLLDNAQGMMNSATDVLDAFCVNCGAVIEPGDVFCTNCGINLLDALSPSAQSEESDTTELDRFLSEYEEAVVGVEHPYPTDLVFSLQLPRCQ